MKMESQTMIGSVYIVLGVLGVICNLATALMIITRRVFRLSAYTIMANIALADSVMAGLSGVIYGIMLLCGLPPEFNTIPQFNISSHGLLFTTTDNSLSLDSSNLTDHEDLITNYTTKRVLRSMMPTPEKFIRAGLENHQMNLQNEYNMLQLLIVFLEIVSWTAGIVSYAYLGLNRCVAICLYSTKAKVFNRVGVALILSISTWIIGITVACIGTFPDPLTNDLDMWSISFMKTSGQRSVVFLAVILFINGVSLILQWICSTLVLLKIRQVKQKINKNKLNQNSANRFRKQARLTFQFFWPSILCTISSILYFSKPFIWGMLTDRYLIAFHIIFLLHRVSNPGIYAFFNDRMRLTYWDILTCATIRYKIRKHRKQRGFQRQNSRATMSRKSHGQRSNRMSTKSTKWQRDGIVRSSLQAQSRDFEQLCEFMMRVNPMYDSSEGWREESDSEVEYEHRPLETRSEQANAHRESRSIVMDLGAQTVQQWARFAKKASI